MGGGPGPWGQGPGGNWGQGTPPPSSMGGYDHYQGGPPGQWGPGSPGMNRGRGMGPRGHNMGPGAPSMGPGFGPPGMGHNGPPELTNRGRSLLGAPPGLDSPNPLPPSVPTGPPQPAPPATQQLDQQLVTLKASIKTLQEQIVQSESNLTAQWTVLQQNQMV